VRKGKQLSSVVALVVALVLALLGGLHVFWALGGPWGKQAAIPEAGGRPALRPSALMTFGVAAALFIAALLVLARVGFVATALAPSFFVWPTLLLGVAFIARAVGEFRLVGFFKRVRGTTFARWDSFVFSPLCLVLGSSILWLALR
jgi:hypothetical protein